MRSAAVPAEDQTPTAHHTVSEVQDFQLKAGVTGFVKRDVLIEKGRPLAQFLQQDAVFIETRGRGIRPAWSEDAQTGLAGWTPRPAHR